MHSRPLKLLLLVILLMVGRPANCQQSPSWERYLDELSTADDEDFAVSEDVFEVLSSLADNPIDINRATRDDLEQLPFLTAQQIEDIIAYVWKSGGVKSIGELQMIESLDAARRQLLTYFIYIGSEDKDKSKFPRIKDIMKDGKHELLATGLVPFYDRRGDRNGFLGPKYRHSVRYEFSYSDFIRIGLQGAQDAGEPFFADSNTMGYDHYSYYLMLRRLGRVKTLVVGQYKLRFGMGLVMNTAFGFGKLMTVSSLGRSSNSVRPNTSRSAANYLQGAATTVTVARHLDATAFISYRGIDATLSDSNTISTIVKTGYHRTPKEMSKKNDAHQLAAGGNVHWSGGGFHVGLTGVYSRLDHELRPNTRQAYRKNYPHGQSFWNAGVDYGYINHRWTIAGETATGGSGGVATINSVSLSASKSLSVIALQRYYSSKYYSLFSQSFSDGGRVQNENGIYIGANWHPLKHLSIMAYSDYAYFSDPRYQASRSSRSWDNTLSATLAVKKWTVAGRYKLKIREKDNKQKTLLVDDITHRGRLSVRYSEQRWSARLQGDVAFNRYKQDSFGWMTTATGSYSVWRLKIVGTMGYFHTEGYESRIYGYERGPLYSFSFPAFYGEGIRYAVFVRADVTKRLLVIAKGSTTDYFDRDHIASGLQQIDRSSQSSLELQLRWKF